jgi:hypothetical protein
MRGVYVVEFAVVGLLLFILLFGALEMGRLLFTVNTLNESVRRGARLAVVCNIQDPEILRKAVFANTSSTVSTLIGNLDTTDLVLRYFDQNGAQITDPSPSGGFSQIRFVQVSIENFPFHLMIPVLGGDILLQPFRALLPRESLGRHAEQGVVPEITPC